VVSRSIHKTLQGKGKLVRQAGKSEGIERSSFEKAVSVAKMISQDVVARNDYNSDNYVLQIRQNDVKPEMNAVMLSLEKKFEAVNLEI
jgi:hypothetical protein